MTRRSGRRCARPVRLAQVADDAGYFGAPPAGSLRPGDRHRPFAGRAAPVAPAAARLRRLVCINGFARFGAGPDFPEGVAPRLLDRMLRQLVAQPRRCCAISARAAATTRHPARRHGRAGTRPAAARRGPARRTGGAAHAGAGAGRRRGSGRAAGRPARRCRRRAALACARRPFAAAIGPAVVRRTHPRLRARPGRHRT